MTEKTDKKELLIEIQGLTRGYPQSPTFVFDKFDFKLYKNDFVFILGKSGVGKTTLVKLLLRQIMPPKKMIFYKKEDLARYTDTEVQKYRRKIGVIFQDYKLIDWKTVNQNIVYPLEMMGISQEKINKKLNEILYQMELMDKKDTLVPKLSGGEKQRVAIARALIANPEFIMADEPTGNLDRQTAQKIVDILIDLNKLGNTILFITHDLELVDYVKNKHNVKITRI